MKGFIFYACLMACSPGFAELSAEHKAKLLQITKDVVTEKTDEFDKEITIKYTGPEILLSDGCKVGSFVWWKEGELQKPTFMFSVRRVQPDWRWLKFGKTQMLADGELVDLRAHKLVTDVLDGGDVSEAQYVELPLEQVLRVVVAEEAKMRVGLDEWTLSPAHRLPLQVVVSRWIGLGGDVDAYKDLLKLILRPSKGDTYAAVVQHYGEPSQRNSETGWALWPGFWARFKDAKVVETRVDRDKKAP